MPDSGLYRREKDHHVAFATKTSQSEQTHVHVLKKPVQMGI
jgi:hypothetical protein